MQLKALGWRGCCAEVLPEEQELDTTRGKRDARRKVEADSLIAGEEVVG